MRCPECRAANPDTATFCGQCHVRFDVQGPPAAQAPAPTMPVLDDAVPEIPLPDVATPDALTSPAQDPVARGPVAPGPVAAGRFRAADGALSWTCAVCGESNGLSSFTCDICGARMDAEAEDAANRPDWTAVRRIEALAPGVGHIQAGMIGIGTARVAMVVLWALGVLVLASGGSAGLLTAIPLVVGIAVIWVTGPGDLAAAGGGRPPRLDARRFMFLVIGVTAAVITFGGIGVAL